MSTDSAFGWDDAEVIELEFFPCVNASGEAVLKVNGREVFREKLPEKCELRMFFDTQFERRTLILGDRVEK